MDLKNRDLVNSINCTKVYPLVYIKICGLNVSSPCVSDYKRSQNLENMTNTATKPSINYWCLLFPASNLLVGKPRPPLHHMSFCRKFIGLTLWSSTAFIALLALD